MRILNGTVNENNILSQILVKNSSLLHLIGFALKFLYFYILMSQLEQEKDH